MWIRANEIIAQLFLVLLLITVITNTDSRILQIGLAFVIVCDIVWLLRRIN